MLENLINKIKNIFSVENETANYIKNIQNYTYDIVDYAFNGDKFPGSFGTTKDYSFVDYYTLRKRSIQLFKENPYCDTLIKRLLLHELSDGLKLQASPVDEVLKISTDKSQAWADDTENFWNLYSNDELICDWKKKKTLPELHRDARRTALISGDCLCVLRLDGKTKLPLIEIIDGSNIKTPMNYKGKNDIKHGVELDANGRHIAYHIENNKGESIRLSAWGEKSGRRVCWMLYGSVDRLLDDVRGEPIIAKMLYSMKELDRYRDSEQRAAVINAMIPLIVARTAPGFSSNSFGLGATRKGTVTGDPNASSSSSENQTVNYTGINPGFIAYTNAGEQIQSFNTQRPNVNFGKFEEIIFNLFCQVLELPPEVGRLIYSSSYSASRQARNDLNMYIDYRAKQNGREFLKPIYEEWVVAMSVSRKIVNDDLVQAWIINDWVKYNAWLNAEWIAKTTPSVDILKDVQAAIYMIENNLATADSQTRKLVNMPYSTVLKKRKREIELAKKFGLSTEIKKPNNANQNENTNQETNELRLITIESLLESLSEQIESRVN